MKGIPLYMEHDKIRHVGEVIKTFWTEDDLKIMAKLNTNVLTTNNDKKTLGSLSIGYPPGLKKRNQNNIQDVYKNCPFNEPIILGLGSEGNKQAQMKKKKKKKSNKKKTQQTQLMSQQQVNNQGHDLPKSNEDDDIFDGSQLDHLSSTDIKKILWHIKQERDAIAESNRKMQDYETEFKQNQSLGLKCTADTLQKFLGHQFGEKEQELLVSVFMNVSSQQIACLLQKIAAKIIITTTLAEQQECIQKSGSVHNDKPPNYKFNEQNNPLHAPIPEYIGTEPCGMAKEATVSPVDDNLLLKKDKNTIAQ